MSTFASYQTPLPGGDWEPVDPDDVPDELPEYVSAICVEEESDETYFLKFGDDRRNDVFGYRHDGFDDLDEAAAAFAEEYPDQYGVDR